MRGVNRLAPETVYALARWAGCDPGQATIALAIAYPESELNADAHNGNASTGDDSYGLFQINLLGPLGPPRRREFGLTDDRELLNPYVNARAMWSISGHGSNWRPWTTFKLAKHEPFMDTARAIAAAVGDNWADHLPDTGDDTVALARTTFDGYVTDVRTARQLAAAEKILGRKIELSQGSFSNGGASAGTHRGSGVIDGSTRQMGVDTKAEGDALIRALDEVGILAWIRDLPEWTGDVHWHGISLGSPQLAPAAQAQVEDAKRGRNGLANHQPDQHKALRTWATWESFLADKAKAQKPTDKHEPGSRELNLGDKGTDVAFVQKIVGAKQDGWFGEATLRRVKAWQAKHTLLADGVIAKFTWRKMLS